MKPYAPLGILYLSSHLRAKGFDCEIYDSTFQSRDDLFKVLEDSTPGIVGIYGNLMTRANVLAIIARARAAGWRVILGGPEPANYASEYLESGAEVIVAGEGETALEQLIATGMDPNQWPSTDGIIFRAADGTIVRTTPARLIPDLDAQPWPDRERIDIPRYLDTWRRHHGKGSVSVITARGCPYSCTWCSHSVYGKSHRRRSPGSVATEIEYLLDRYHPEMLWIADDVFTINHGWIREYSAELRRRSVRVPFECITRADRLTDEIAAVLAELGCIRVWVGSESGSQRILDAMQRGVKIEQVHRAIAACKLNGIETGMFLMWGYDGEDLSDIEATVTHVKQCRPDIFLTTVSYPICGTPYFVTVSDRIVSIGGWSTRTDRDYKLRGRHSRRFYQCADELLRSEMSPEPDMERIRAARAALYETRSEVEA